MEVVALTGTPGTGKSSVSLCLRGMGCNVMNVSNLITELGISVSFSRRHRSSEVDTEELRAKADAYIAGLKGSRVILSGHLSHFISCDVAVVLRCEPHVLYERLTKRGWRERKVAENIRAEILDVILVEAVERIKRVYEIDTTKRDAGRTAELLLEAVNGRAKSLKPGRVDWTGEIEEWF